jgi:hypothetical protein
MNVAALDRAMNGNKATTEEELNLLYEGMVKGGGIAYCEFPRIVEAKKLRDKLVLQQNEFEAFKADGKNKKFPEQELEVLKGEWRTILRGLARLSGQSYSETKDWKMENTFQSTPFLAAMANLQFPEEFIEGVDVTEAYNNRFMQLHKELSDLENAWDIRQGWPVLFQPDYVDSWQPAKIAGRDIEYFLPRQRFKRLAGGGQTGIWVDKWMSEVLEKQVRLSNKGAFLDVTAKWIEEYSTENP